jgi:hypothetical protein
VTDKEETIQIVQKGFPELAEFDEERITLLNGDGAIIFDEAWEHFASSPPEKLQIVVADAPGEWEKRKSTRYPRGSHADNFRSETKSKTKYYRMWLCIWRTLDRVRFDLHSYCRRVSEEVGGRISGQ